MRYFGAAVEAVACSGPGSRTAVSSRDRVKDGGVLKEGGSGSHVQGGLGTETTTDGCLKNC
jgi:hypothetical protein